VKFNLPNRFDIYLHDTPHRELFDKTDRWQSSGCVRVQKPREMALFILSDIEGRHFTNETIDSIIRTQKTKWEILKNKIPVHIVYLTAIEDDTHGYIRFTKDVYKRDRKLAAALKAGA
jgi:murein L,D-transpeptidase YcbB/YkuD